MNQIGEVLNGVLKPHIFPYQKPHPPIGIAGLSPGSETLKLAGERRGGVGEVRRFDDGQAAPGILAAIGFGTLLMVVFDYSH